MAVTGIEVNNYLMFKGEFTINFGPGINVIIGGNGTGKTTLLRHMFSSTSSYAFQLRKYAASLEHLDSENHSIRITSIPDLFTRNITKCNSENRAASQPSFNVEYLITSNGINAFKTCVPEDPIDEAFIASDTEENKQRAVLREHVYRYTTLEDYVMIPDTEMLSHSKGLLALHYQRVMPFDKTEIDILAKAQLPITREIKPNASKILSLLRGIIGGEVVYENDEFFMLRDNGLKIPYSLEASGNKKLGLLWKILRNGLLESESILFWDEPESSLNPEVFPTLANILLELSRNSVQVFVATHSELFASYLSVNRVKGDKVMFYSLYKDDDKIKVDTSDRFDLLDPNPLTDSSTNLYKAELEKGLGGNG